MEAAKGLLQASAQIMFSGNQKELTEAGEETVGRVEVLCFLTGPIVLQGMSARLDYDSTLAPDDRVGQSYKDSVLKTVDEMIKLLQTACKVNKADESTQAALEGQGEVVTASINGIMAALRRFTNLASAQQITLDGITCPGAWSHVQMTWTAWQSKSCSSVRRSSRKQCPLWLHSMCLPVPRGPRTSSTSQISMLPSWMLPLPWV